MENSILTDINRRHDFVLFFEVTDGNPNGDPDAGNMPRVDPETMQGLVTDVCLKRKVRNFVAATQNGDERNKIYVEHHGVLNEQHQRAYTAKNLDTKGTKQDRGTIDIARKWMCENFYDIRMFGAVMTTGVNCGQVRGPLQLTFARSIDPIVPLDLSITRVAVTKTEDARGEDGESGKQTEMGRKSLVPYGLYRGHGFFSPSLGQDTGVIANDLKVFWDALQQMWDLDRSASRGLMSLRGLYIFSHEKPHGNAPAHKLFDLIVVKRQNEDKPARLFSDYVVSVNTAGKPSGVELTTLVG